VRLTPNEVAYCLARTAIPAAEVVVGVAVAFAESRGDTEALGYNETSGDPRASGSYDCGLWQVNNYWHGNKFAQYNWRDPFDNAEMAYLAWVEGKRTWNPWSTFKSGAYTKWMPAATIGVRNPREPIAFPELPDLSPHVRQFNVDLADLARVLREIRAVYR